MARIVTLTMNPSVDVSAGVDHVRPNQKLRCSPPQYEPGGGGINVSRAIHKLGGESLAMFPAGGYMGGMFVRLAEEAGIACEMLEVDGTTRENLTANEEGSGQQFRFVMPGPNLAEREWKAVLESLERLDPAPDFIVASGSLPSGAPVDFYARVAQLAAQIGCRCIVDTSGQPLCEALEEGVFLIKPNRNELQQIAGEEIRDEAHEEEIARSIVESGGCEVLAVSLGSAGVLMVTGEGQRRFRAPDVTIRSRVGAGDSMVAGMVLGLARGNRAEEAVRFGVAAGAAAVMTPGSELCQREDAEALYERLSGEGNPA